jgi:hypothetical protein
MDNVNESRIIRFGLFEMDLRAGELRKNGIEDRSGDLGRLGRVVTSGIRTYYAQSRRLIGFDQSAGPEQRLRKPCVYYVSMTDMIPGGRKMKFASRKQLNQQKKTEKQFDPVKLIHLSKKQMVGVKP